jgi:hypothetical protein
MPLLPPELNFIPPWLSNINPNSIQNIASGATTLSQMDIIGIIAVGLALINIFIGFAWIMEVQARRRIRR